MFFVEERPVRGKDSWAPLVLIRVISWIGHRRQNKIHQITRNQQEMDRYSSFAMVELLAI